MVVVALTLILPSNYTYAEIGLAQQSCEIGAATIGIPSWAASRVTEEDLPALITETIESALGVYVLDFGDGDTWEYTDWYEVSHTYDVQVNLPCAE